MRRIIACQFLFKTHFRIFFVVWLWPTDDRSVRTQGLLQHLPEGGPGGGYGPGPNQSCPILGSCGGGGGWGVGEFG
jgi:hypothetical protein